MYESGPVIIRERRVGAGGTLKKLVSSPKGIQTSIIFKIPVLPRQNPVEYGL